MRDLEALKKVAEGQIAEVIVRAVNMALAGVNAPGRATEGDVTYYAGEVVRLPALSSLLAELERARSELRALNRAAEDVLTGISVHNQLHADAPARRDDIYGPVVASLRAAVASARSALTQENGNG